MEFFFLNKSQFELTKYSYQDFDNITRNFGYDQSKNESLHNYFDWNKLQHWTFKYEAYSSLELSELFGRTIIFKDSIFFIIRVLHHLPLIKVNAINLGGMVEDLCYETGMGWEAISGCGKYILEFTDSYEFKAKSNFEILPSTSPRIGSATT